MLLDIKKIKLLAEILTINNLSELELCEGDSKIVLKRSAQPAAQTQLVAQSKTAVISEETVSATVAPAAPGKFIKAPFAGVFYTKPSPDSEPFVKVGDTVAKTDIVCILEAMKLMNELKAELDGVIAEICVENSSVVEYGQPLFRIV